MYEVTSTKALAQVLRLAQTDNFFYITGRACVARKEVPTNTPLATPLYWAEGKLVLTANQGHTWTLGYQEGVPDTGFHFQTQGEFTCQTEVNTGEHIRVDLSGALEGYVLKFTPKGACIA